MSEVLEIESLEQPVIDPSVATTLLPLMSVSMPIQERMSLPPSFDGSVWTRRGAREIVTFEYQRSIMAALEGNVGRVEEKGSPKAIG